MAAVVYTGTIAGLIVPADSGNTAVVTFESTDTTFLNSCPNKRVKFDKTNKEVYSYIMSLYVSGKVVGFYYNPNGNTLPAIPGHSTGNCELGSIWGNGA